MAERPRRVGGDEGGVVGDRERPRPGVEELRRARAGEDLRAEEDPGDIRRPGHEGVPGVGVGMHERAGAEVVLRGSPLHEIRREGERGTGEADEWGRAELLDGAGDAGGDRGECGGIEVTQRSHIRRRPDRRSEDRTATRHDVDVDARQLEGNHDVTEEDRRVHPMTAPGLKGDLARELRIEARVEHRRSDAQGTVLRKRAAGLPHEPHRRHLGTVTTVGADDGGFGGTPVDEGVLCWQIHTSSLPADRGDSLSGDTSYDGLCYFA